MSNFCANKIVSYYVIINDLIWLDYLPSFTHEEFSKNKYDLPYYRFK